MSPELDILDIKILESLYHTRNLSEVARRLGISEETVRRRVQKLYYYGRITAEPDYTALGLEYSLYIVDNFDQEAVEILPELYALSVCKLVTLKGVRTLVVLAPPVELTKSVRLLLENLIGPGRFIISEDPIKWKPNAKFFDPTRRGFFYPWEEVIEALTQPYIIEKDDSKSKAIRSLPRPRRNLDLLDVIILRVLHQDALTPLSEIARIAGVYPQKIWYHYKYHVSPLIKHHMINMVFFPRDEVPISLYELRFSSYEHVRAFIKVMQENPFFKVMIPVKHEPTLIIVSQLPSEQQLRFVKTISELKSLGILEECSMIGFMDPSYIRAFTVPDENMYSDGMWIIRKETIERIQEFLRTRKESMRFYQRA